eukprot:COSAG05_NODE_10244_length_576_cov_0.635220_1_plen_142_part_00
MTGKPPMASIRAARMVRNKCGSDGNGGGSWVCQQVRAIDPSQIPPKNILPPRERIPLSSIDACSPLGRAFGLRKEPHLASAATAAASVSAARGGGGTQGGAAPGEEARERGKAAHTPRAAGGWWRGGEGGGVGSPKTPHVS